MESHIWKIEWNDRMSVGIPEVDEDHKRFATLINAFNQSILDRMDLSEIKKRLEHVIDDAAEHFAHEEKLFKEWQYPNAEEHANKHVETIAAYKAVLDKFVSYDFASEWIEAGQYVKDLLIGHLINEDMKYAEFYQKHLYDGDVPNLLGKKSSGENSGVQKV
jgi:hemerythrin-like metal-binding protein